MATTSDDLHHMFTQHVVQTRHGRLAEGKAARQHR